MTVQELLHHPLLDLPKSWQDVGAESYYQFVVRTGREYLSLLEQLDRVEIADRGDSYMGQISHKEIVLDTATKLYRAIIHSIRIYIDEGNPVGAYESFQREFVQARPIHPLFVPTSYLMSHRIREDEVFYRIRDETKSGLVLDKARELFHIPFELRHIVAPQRFSIAGYPCLYAANSVFLAHQELGDPEWSERIYVSKLKALPSIELPVILLDLRNNVEAMRAAKRHDGRLMNFLVTWLLTMATSIKSAYPNAPFKEEYILPQLVLQWVNNVRRESVKWFSGVAFSSARLPLSNPHYTGSFYNIVIPVHHTLQSGLCEVRTKQFEVSAPITIKEASSKSTVFTHVVKTIAHEGAPIDYAGTPAALIEAALHEQAYYSLQSKPDADSQ